MRWKRPKKGHQKQRPATLCLSVCLYVSLASRNRIVFVESRPPGITLGFPLSDAPGPLPPQCVFAFLPLRSYAGGPLVGGHGGLSNAPHRRQCARRDALHRRHGHSFFPPRVGWLAKIPCLILTVSRPWPTASMRGNHFVRIKWFCFPASLSPCGW